MDAGHCPGSVMVVILGVPGGPILNTGDFRYHDGLLQSSTLKHLAAGGSGSNGFVSTCLAPMSHHCHSRGRA